MWPTLERDFSVTPRKNLIVVLMDGVDDNCHDWLYEITTEIILTFTAGILQSNADIIFLNEWKGR